MTKKTSTIFAPANSCQIDLCTGSDCPIEIINCNHRCFEIHSCRSATIPLDLGCNRSTGLDLLTSELLGLEINIFYNDEDGNRVDLQHYNLVDNASSFNLSQYNKVFFTLTPEQTAALPGGSLKLEGYIESEAGTYLRWDANLCVTKPTYASPIVCVSGPEGEGTGFTLVNGVATLYFHDSDTVHVNKRWDRFEISWGEGTVTTLDVSGVADQSDPALMQVTFDYGAAAGPGDYTLCVTGYLEYDPQNPCDVELESCACLDFCLNII